MSENHQYQLKQVLLLALVLLLVFIAGVQTWYIMDMKKRLDAIHPVAVVAKPATNPSTNSTAGGGTANASTDLQTSSNSNSQKPATPPLFDDNIFAAPNSRDWDPFEEIQRMQRNMDRMFNNAFSQFNQSPDFGHLYRQGITAPQMDVKEEDDHYTVIVDLPGADEHNISVNLEDQMLTVRGEQDYQKQDKNANGEVIFRERRSGTFQRSISLPQPVEQVGMKSEVDNGVLTITIPKKKATG